MSKSGLLQLTSEGRCNVRMSPFEYRRIKKDSEASRKSIAELLRESYFSQPPRKVLMDRKDVDLLRKDLSRIGNNLNQVARRLNTGLFHGWNNTLNLIWEELRALKKQIHYGYGVPKN